jgi:hypothetical protein
MKLFISITFVLLFAISNSFSQDEEMKDKIKDAMDYDNAITRDFALKIARKYPGNSIRQLCKIYDYLRNNWSYVKDPYGQEYFSKASESAQIMSGDCDDYAILMATCLFDIGFNTRVVLTTGHAYAEFYAGNTKKEIQKSADQIISSYFWMSLVTEGVHYHTDDNGYWINLDWTSVYPGGPYQNNGSYYAVIYP